MELAPNPICDRVRGQISLELDGELSQLERAMVASHVRRCPSCAAFRANATSFTLSMRTAPLEALERPIELPSLRRRALAEVRFSTVRIAAVAAGIAIALSLGVSTNTEFLGSRTPTGASGARAAYLDSMDYERQIMREQIDRSNGTNKTIAV